MGRANGWRPRSTPDGVFPEGVVAGECLRFAVEAEKTQSNEKAHKTRHDVTPALAKKALSLTTRSPRLVLVREPD